MRLSGRIMSSGTQPTPINGARIEIWQTDGDGDYHPAGNGAYEDYADEDIDLRGTVISDENGAYSVMTLIPGAYFPRPRHFHYRITAPGYEPLVTQLYITGDGVISQPGGDCRHAEIEEFKRWLALQRAGHLSGDQLVRRLRFRTITEFVSFQTFEPCRSMETRRALMNNGKTV